MLVGTSVGRVLAGATTSTWRKYDMTLFEWLYYHLFGLRIGRRSHASVPVPETRRAEDLGP